MRKDLKSVFSGVQVENVIKGAEEQLDPNKAVIIIGTDQLGRPYVSSSCGLNKTLRKLKGARKHIMAMIEPCDDAGAQ